MTNLESYELLIKQVDKLTEYLMMDMCVFVRVDKKYLECWKLEVCEDDNDYELCWKSDYWEGEYVELVKIVPIDVVISYYIDMEVKKWQEK